MGVITLSAGGLLLLLNVALFYFCILPRLQKNKSSTSVEDVTIREKYAPEPLPSENKNNSSVTIDVGKGRKLTIEGDNAEKALKSRDVAKFVRRMASDEDSNSSIDEPPPPPASSTNKSNPLASSTNSSKYSTRVFKEDREIINEMDLVDPDMDLCSFGETKSITTQRSIATSMYSGTAGSKRNLSEYVAETKWDMGGTKNGGKRSSSIGGGAGKYRIFKLSPSGPRV